MVVGLIPGTSFNFVVTYLVLSVLGFTFIYMFAAVNLLAIKCPPDSKNIHKGTWSKTGQLRPQSESVRNC